MVDDSIDLSNPQDLVKAGWPKNMVDEHVNEHIKTSSSLVGSAIYIDNLSKAFNNRAVLSNVSLAIKPKEIFGIIGLSGAGKTTLMNLMVGFLEPDAGDVVVRTPTGNNVSVYKFPEVIKSVFGFSTQYPSFYSKLTVKENLAYFGELFDMTTAQIYERTKELLDLVKLTSFENTLAGNLSGGMQKRLDIACALIHKPNILLLDEPTADLDPLLRRQMWKIIKDINKTGTTVIVCSHFIDEIENYCSRIAVLNNRTISFIGNIDDIKNKYTTNFEIQLRTAKGSYDTILSELSKHSAIARHKIVDDRLVLYTSTPKKVLSDLFKIVGKHRDSIISLDLARPSLKEAFEALVQ
ncbi:ATP-binding cassette domain-containing protein [Candidatus Woesearchaeota archaeon]|nr:ATP-binding cassette domain-containing protein [Candidatus Woesearchaeota archaeon]